MLKTSLLCLCAAAAAFSQIQPPGYELMSGSVSVGGVTVGIRTMVQSFTGSSRMQFGGFKDGHDRAHRFIEDKSGRWFGYDLVVERGNAEGEYVLRFEPLTDVEEAPPRVLPLPKYPPPQVVRERDTVALDLMVSADGQHKIVDYLQIVSGSTEPPAPAQTGERREFTLDDGPVSLDLSRTAAFVNGTPAPAPAITIRKGATFWFAFPGKGRYILSLSPQPQFRLAGAIRDNALAFEDGEDRYEIRFASPIAGAGRAWKLYVMHEPRYAAEAAAGGLDTLDHLTNRTTSAR